VERGNKHAHPSKQEAELDMYADDFEQKEKAKQDNTNSSTYTYILKYIASIIFFSKDIFI